MLKLTKIPLQFMKLSWVEFPLRDSTPSRVRIRTYVISDQLAFELPRAESSPGASKVKPTIVIIHGFAASSAMMFTLFRPLLAHFRIVCLDMLGYGRSTRVKITDESILEDCDRTDAYMMEWLDQWLDHMTEELELPSQFHLCGHSYGGYISALFACRHRHRIQGLFLNSAIGAETQPEDFDPYQVRITATDFGPPPGWESLFWQNMFESQKTPLDLCRSMPDFMTKFFAERMLEDDMT